MEQFILALLLTTACLKYTCKCFSFLGLGDRQADIGARCRSSANALAKATSAPRLLERCEKWGLSGKEMEVKWRVSEKAGQLQCNISFRLKLKTIFSPRGISKKKKMEWAHFFQQVNS